MKYLPFLNGIYSTAPGLTSLAKAASAEEQFVFQTDDQYHKYLANKKACRSENIGKYYLQYAPVTGTTTEINNYLARQLQQEHPAHFDYSETGNQCLLINLQTGEVIQWHKYSMKLSNANYINLFDALCSQVQEDLAICQLENDKDWLADVHLCTPNHWSPADKIGKPFNAVHAPVPGMEKTMPHYFKMLQSVINKGPFTRFAWGIATDDRLNHHPEAPPGADQLEWQGRSINNAAQLFIRTERQNLVGFPQSNAFLFTIRTYFYPVNLLLDHEKTALWSAVRSMSPEALSYKGLTGVTDFLAKHLFD